MDTVISTQKKKLEQKKARIQQQEINLKLKERKARVRHLIEIGGLMTKAKIDHLPSDVLLGACLDIKKSIEKDNSIVNSWKQIGASVFETETKNKTPIILKFDDKPDQNIRNIVRAQGLKWNNLRQEWYGYADDIVSLKQYLKGLQFSLEILDIND